MSLRLGYIITVFLGFLGGTVIGFNLSLSLSLLNLLSQGFYIDDWIFNDTFYAFFIGIPTGGLVMTGVSIVLLKKGVQPFRLSVWFSIGIILSILLSSSLDQRLRPPIVRVTQLNQLSKVQKAIQRGDNLNAQDINGRTALSEASRKGYTAIVKALIQAGADFNITTDSGWTALMKAVQEGNNEIVKLLIQAGADVNATNNDSDTALSIANYYGRTEITQILCEAGAKE